MPSAKCRAGALPGATEVPLTRALLASPASPGATPRPLSCPSPGYTWSSAPPGLCSRCSLCLRCPSLPSLYPSSLLSLAFSALGRLFHGGSGTPITPVPGGSVAFRCTGSPGGQCLPHRRWSVGVHGGGQDSWQRGGEESWLRTCWLLLHEDSALPRHRGPERREQRPASHAAPALAPSPSLSVLICELGAAWPLPLAGPLAPRGRAAGLRPALTRCQREADCPALSPQVTTMSARVRFLSSGDAGTVGVMGRSASFAGFSSAQSRRVA